MTPRTFRRCLILTLLALFPGLAAAQSWYQVEIVIFEQHNAADDREQRTELEVPAPDEAQELKEVGAGGAFARLADSQLQLGGVAQALRGAGQRRPILHWAWRQPVTGRSRAQPIRIHGGREYTLPAPVRAPLDPDTSALSLELRPAPGGFAPQHRTVEAVDGTLLVTRSRYLHVWTDLVFTTPASAAPGPRSAAAGNELVQFRMQGHRRMRSGELHYLDHPAFGMIILFTPIDAPATEAPSTAESAADAGEPAAD